MYPQSVVALHPSDVPFDLAFTIDEASASEAQVAYLRSLEQFAAWQLYLSADTTQPGPDRSLGAEPSRDPTAFALFPKDLALAPLALAEKPFRVERFTVRPHGRHFAALEQPALLAEDLVRFLDNRS